MTHVIRQIVQAVEQAEANMMSRTTSTSTTTVCMNRSYLLVMKAVLDHTEVFDLQYGIPFADGFIEDMVYDVMPSRHLPKQPRSSYVLCVSFAAR